MSLSRSPLLFFGSDFPCIGCGGGTVGSDAPGGNKAKMLRTAAASGGFKKDGKDDDDDDDAAARTTGKNPTWTHQ